MAGRTIPAPSGPRGRLVVVDDDWDSLERLSRVLQDRGHHVALATDGRTGLERAVELAAEVIVVDRDIAIVDIRTFLDVLAENPRTADSHVFVLGSGDRFELAAISGRAEPIVKPFHPDELASRIDEVIRAKKTPPQAQDIGGDLSQVALFDLLQVFNQNERTGVLSIENGAAVSEVWMERGRVVDAQSGNATGEKAFFRIASMRKGRFAFHPDRHPLRTRIHRDMTSLLMEAVRDADERVILKSKLPPRGCLFRLAVEPPRSPDQSGSSEAMIEILREHHSIDSLLDALPYSDLEILQRLAGWWSGGLMQVTSEETRVRFCESEEVPAVRSAILRLRRAGFDGPARLGVTGNALSIAKLTRCLLALEEWSASEIPPLEIDGSAFGPLGNLSVGGVDLELFSVPASSAFSPWQEVFLGGFRTMHGKESSVDVLSRTIDASSIPESPSIAVQAVREALELSPEPRRADIVRVTTEA